MSRGHYGAGSLARMDVAVDRAEYERLGGPPGCDIIMLVVDGCHSDAERVDQASKLIEEICPGLHVLSVSESPEFGTNDE